MDFEELEKHLDKIMHEQNNRSMPEFEGYSPAEMHLILYSTFEKDSPIELQKLSEADYKKVPILNQIKYLMGMIAESGEMKLTKKGFLPVKVVAELYQQGFIKDDQIEKGISKLYKESDSMSINLPRILIELAGLVKKRHGKLSLTKAGQKIISDDQKLLRAIMETFATKFNWAYYDGYGENHIGQLGYGFTLILLSKYGREKRLDSFYAKKYFNAFPRLLDAIAPDYGTVERQAASCYSVRSFNRFLDYFGVVEIDEKWKKFDRETHITKTELFDRLIKIRPHKS